MIDIDASIDKAPPEYKDALKAEKKPTQEFTKPPKPFWPRLA
jgi:hypothetical protein